MRMIMKAAVVAGALATGMAVAAPAQAATHSWSAPSTYDSAASGTYFKGNGTVWVKGTLVHTRNNGYSSCVDVWYVQGNQKQEHGGCIYDRRTGRYTTGKVSLAFKDSAHLTGHLYVRVGHIKNGQRVPSGWGRMKKIY